MKVRKLHDYLPIYCKIAGLCNKSMKFINKCIVVIIKYLHMAKQCKADIWQINVMWTSLGGTCHSHTQKSTFPQKSGDTVNAQIHNATIPYSSRG